ncbi:hypothetical protein RND81_14G208600 [Saponaria officinalis]|uniref:Uncharacterized protein n=1 Tax=Saponaria officinalis TaxID=3572 RepID=A0AAW1GPR1_SAPOF
MGQDKAGEVVKSLKYPPSPPLPPSYTRREIDRFWRRKRLVEEEHFLAAIKAAARRRASQLSEGDYKAFLESLEEIKIKEDDNKDYYDNNQEIRVGIKDWWTKSKYAYLNQPAIGTTMRPNKRSNYKPNNMFFCNYKLLPSKAHSLGVY